MAIIITGVIAGATAFVFFSNFLQVKTSFRSVSPIRKITAFLAPREALGQELSGPFLIRKLGVRQFPSFDEVIFGPDPKQFL